MPQVAIHGTRLHYIEEGSGAPVLLLHGVNCGAEGWRDTVGRLAPFVRVVAPDLPGWGDTPPPPGFTYDMKGLTRFLLDLMDALGLPTATIVGWSFGGTAAMHLAAAAPERVDRLVLMAPGGLDPEVHWSFRALAVPGLGEWLLRPTPANILAGIGKLVYGGRSLSTDFRAYLMRVGRNPWFCQTTLRWVRRNRVFWEGARRICIGEDLDRISCPTLVLWGEEDPLVPPAHAALAARIPGAKVTLLPKAGHILHLEVPDLVQASLLEFLAAGPAQS